MDLAWLFEMIEYWGEGGYVSNGLVIRYYTFMAGVFTLPNVAGEAWRTGVAFFFHPTGALTYSSKEGTDKLVLFTRAGTT